MKWQRIRPGLYHLVDPGSKWPVAQVERGAETGQWWLVAFGSVEGDNVYSRSLTLKRAKKDAELFVRDIDECPF